MTNLIDEMTWDHYCQTRLLFSLKNHNCRLIPNESGNNSWPWHDDITDIFILSAIHPRSQQSTDEEIVPLQQRMVEILNNLSLNYMNCIGKPAQDGWPEEESFLLTDADEETIIKLCKEFDQNAYFHWNKEFWSVKGVFAEQTYFTNWSLEN